MGLWRGLRRAGLERGGALVAALARSLTPQIPPSPTKTQAFRKNNPEAATFCANCNVILRAAMVRAGQADDCLACDDAVTQAAAMAPEQLAQLPRPGEVEFIMGGPPCQGYSGAFASLSSLPRPPPSSLLRAAAAAATRSLALIPTLAAHNPPLISCILYNRPTTHHNPLTKTHNPTKTHHNSPPPSYTQRQA